MIMPVSCFSFSLSSSLKPLFLLPAHLLSLFCLNSSSCLKIRVRRTTPSYSFLIHSCKERQRRRAIHSLQQYIPMNSTEKKTGWIRGGMRDKLRTRTSETQLLTSIPFFFFFFFSSIWTFFYSSLRSLYFCTSCSFSFCTKLVSLWSWYRVCLSYRYLLVCLLRVFPTLLSSRFSSLSSIIQNLFPSEGKTASRLMISPLPPPKALVFLSPLSFSHTVLSHELNSLFHLLWLWLI